MPPVLRVGLATALAAFVCHVAPAQAADKDCVFFGALTLTSSAPKLAKITGSGHVPLSSSYLAPGHAAPYLIAGDDVVVLATDGARTCVTFTAPSKAARQTDGWVATESLAAAEQTPGSLAAWVGEWHAGPEEMVRFSKAGERLKVTGSATYGATDPERVKRGGVNLGSLDGQVTPVAGQADYADGTGADDCHVRFWQTGPYLVAVDDGNCGGHNVSFSGVYRRKGDRS